LRPTDAADIEALYLQHGPALLLFAVAITGEPSRGQDVIHQVFLKLIESGGSLGALDIKAYLFACVRNAALNEIKIRQRNVALDPQHAWFELPDRDYAEELSLRRAMAALPDAQREATVLHLWAELTFTQIGLVLEISANTAASRYRYALANLREAMCAK
jgi:RNA polymerase sigma factor (sigma-70 family)